MINYNNGKIYKIEPIVEHEAHEIYIGSTTKDKLCQRMATHRNSYNQWLNGMHRKVMSYALFQKYGIENCRIVLIESVNANSKDELLSRETHYITSLQCVNKYSAYQTEEELKEYKNNWYQENKNKILDKKKETYENNKEELLDKNKIYREQNIDKIKERKAKYYEANKEHIISKSKNYIENNKEKVSETKKIYYETNKEDINNYKKEWYQKKKMSTPIITYICQCGSEIREKEKTRHEKTIKHQNCINSLQK